jgi:hypothetical protein
VPPACGVSAGGDGGATGVGTVGVCDSEYVGCAVGEAGVVVGALVVGAAVLAGGV